MRLASSRPALRTSAGLLTGVLVAGTAGWLPWPSSGPAVPSARLVPVAATSPIGGTPTSVHTIALADSSNRPAAGTARTANAVTGAVPSVQDSGERLTAPFSMVGVSWDRSSAAAATFSLRTRTAGRWTGWSTLSTSDMSPDGGRSDDRSSARRSTDPLWVGASDGVEAKLVSTTRPITGVRIELVDPGTRASDAALATVPASGASAGHGTANAVAARAPGVAPAIISRAGWGADERLRNYNPNCSPEYGTTVKMGFVHHTDNANTYSAADVPGIIRSIYAYHVQSNHWCDVGYNFLIDRFGRIFEGRYGGIAMPVIGAHTGAFNTDTFGTSLIGNFTSVTPPAATMNALADLFAWKLGSYYRNPNGKTVLVAGTSDRSSRYAPGQQATFNTISGHRDAAFTTCPGDKAYALLPSLRSMVASRLPHSAIATRYAGLGGPAGVLGEPTLKGEQAVPYGLMTHFQRGSITWAATTGARMLDAAFTATFDRSGGVGGWLGYPVTRDEAPTADGRGRSARFQRGFIHSSPATGAHETHGAIADKYASLRFESGPLGYPQIDTTTRPDGVGRYNRFDGGYIFYTPALGAHAVYGALVSRWRALGFEAGVLGYPTSDTAPTADAVGLYEHFQKGSLFWSPTTGVHEVRGAIQDRYAALNWEQGTLGYPTTDEHTVAPGVVATDFQHGSISWNTTTGVTTVTTTP